MALPRRSLLRLAALGLVLALPAAGVAPGDKAARLSDFLDRLDVQHLWPAGQHVNWDTGVPDGRPISLATRHTHCSAFVAAVAKRLRIYLLRPPEHSAKLLANAQYDWLVEGPGPAAGWHPLADAAAAQAAANQGDLVVAVYRNLHDTRPGHIAIVRPADKSAEALAAEGPDVIQAGAENFSRAPLSVGFAHHPRAWRDGAVRYFAHPIPDDAL